MNADPDPPTIRRTPVPWLFSVLLSLPLAITGFGASVQMGAPMISAVVEEAGTTTPEPRTEGRTRRTWAARLLPHRRSRTPRPANSPRWWDADPTPRSRLRHSPPAGRAPPVLLI